MFTRLLSLGAILSTLIGSACRESEVPTSPTGSGLGALSLQAEASLIAFNTFPQGGGGNYDIALYDRTTASLLPLPGLNNDWHASEPAISEDGRFLVFVSGPDGGAGTDIYLYDRSVPGLVSARRLQSDTHVQYPDISGDGELIAFAGWRRERNGKCGDCVLDLFLYDRTRSQLRSLKKFKGLNTEFQETQPSLNRDGTLVVFSSNRPTIDAGFPHIYLYDFVARTLVDLPGLNCSGCSDHSPSISGDGRYIAFSTHRVDESDGNDIALYDRNTSTLVPLPGLNQQGDNEFFPSISSDGNFIAFESHGDFGFIGYLYDRLTASLVTLPNFDTPGASEERLALP